MSDGDGLLRATIDFALIGLKTLVLVNGAAVVGLMTFIGHVWAEHPSDGAALAAKLFWPIALFLIGLTFGLVTILLAYLTQVIITEVAGGERHDGATRLRNCAISFAIVSLVLFGFGCYAALRAISG